MEQTQNGGKGWLYAIIIVLLLVIIGLVIYFVFFNGKTTTKTTTSPTPSSIPSVTVDQGKFDQYFSNIELAKLPTGQKISDTNQPVATDVFTPKDQFCVNMTALKNIPTTSLSVETGNTATGKIAVAKANYPQPIITNNSNIGCNNLILAAGSYQYKIYIDNTLVSILPFTVQ